MRLSRAILLLLVVAIAALPALATTTTVLVSGTTSGGAVSATIIFNSTSATDLSIELINTSTGINNIAMVLDGLSFTMSGATLTLNSASATGTETCVPSTGSTANCTPGGATTSASSFGWTSFGSFELAAGAGSFKPNGIVNTSVEGAPCDTTNCDGISNAPHNPYLIDATFFFTGTGINLANLGSTLNTFWGTGPDTITSSTPGGGNEPPPPPVPEPATLALMGSGLIAVGSFARRKLQR